MFYRIKQPQFRRWAQGGAVRRQRGGRSGGSSARSTASITGPSSPRTKRTPVTDAAVAKAYGQAVADGTSILYGGSCKPSNAAELFDQEDIDGGLIGGASLKPADFLAVCTAANA